jgi:hypothetical protein
MKWATCKASIGLTVVGAITAACGSSTSVPSTTTVAAIDSIQPGAAKGDLVYVMSPFTNSVYIFSYPQMKLVGVIGERGQLIPTQGLCGDAKGDVFLTLSYAQETTEYAHGGTTPIATLRLPTANMYPENCAYDPTTGDLAVAYAGTSASGVAIYKNETGTATAYTDTYAEYILWCGYDDRGNLFVDSTDRSGFVSLSELPKGTTAFENITLNQSIANSGSVQWDGKHMTIITPVRTGGTAIDRLAISGSKAKVIGSTNLGDHIGSSWSYIFGDRVVVGNQAGNAVQVFKYPAAGGVYLKSVPVYQASGVVVSLASTQRRK